MESDDQVEIVTCSSYLPTFRDGVAVIRDQFCDANLMAGDKIFKVHKIILAAHSKYFHSIFVQNFNERESEEVKMPPEIDAEAMETLLNYFYSGELRISQKNVESVFRATDYMRLDSLMEICIGYMKGTLDSFNCIGRYILADSIQYPSEALEDFKKTASATVVEKAEEVSETVAFLSLNRKFISKIVMCNKQPEQAESLYTLILKWVLHEEDSRREFLCDLVRNIPVEGISNDFFTSKMRNEPLLREDSKILEWLFDSFTPRLAIPVSMFISDRNSYLKCFYLSLPYPTPLAVCNRPTITSYSAVCHKKRIFLLCDNNTANSFRLDGPENSWMDSGLDLDFGRCSAGCVVLGDDLYIAGGCDRISYSCLNSCAKFNFRLGRKDTLPALNESRGLPGAVIYANSVYVACGAGVASTIERFDAREGQWSAVGKYESNFGQCSSATAGDYLYTCGVYDGELARYDFRANCSEKMRAIPRGSNINTWITSIECDLFGCSNGSILKYEAEGDNWTSFSSAIDVDVKCPIVVPWV